MTKTILILAIAAAFVAGATIFGVISDQEVEAAPKKPKPIPPILEPINATLAKLDKYQEQLVVIDFNLAGTVDGIGTSPAPAYSFDEAVILKAEFLDVQDAAVDIIETAEEAIVILDLILD